VPWVGFSARCWVRSAYGGESDPEHRWRVRLRGSAPETPAFLALRPIAWKDRWRDSSSAHHLALPSCCRRRSAECQGAGEKIPGLRSRPRQSTRRTDEPPFRYSDIFTCFDMIAHNKLFVQRNLRLRRFLPGGGQEERPRRDAPRHSALKEQSQVNPRQGIPRTRQKTQHGLAGLSRSQILFSRRDAKGAKEEGPIGDRGDSTLHLRPSALQRRNILFFWQAFRVRTI